MTSPAEDTETPLASPAAAPVILNPVVPFRLDRASVDAKPLALPNTT